MDHDFLGGWRPLVGEEAGGRLQLPSPFILSIPLAGDGFTTAQRKPPVSGRRFQEILLDVRPCTGLWYTVPPFRASRVFTGLPRIGAGWGNVLQEHVMNGYLSHVSKRS